MELPELERRLAELHPASFAWAVVCCRGRREEAEEVLQSVYVQILDGRARFGGRSSFKTWLYAVIRRTARGRARRARLRALLPERLGGAAGAPAPPETAEERIARRRRADRVRAAVRSLSPRQRQVLELVFFHQLTVREAATAMGVSPGTASLHYDRGKRRLNELLAGEAPE